MNFTLNLVHSHRCFIIMVDSSYYIYYNKTIRKIENGGGSQSHGSMQTNEPKIKGQRYLDFYAGCGSVVEIDAKNNQVFLNKPETK